MSKKPHRGRADASPAMDPGLFSESAAAQRGDRKERQLCRQVREAVGEALAVLDDDVLLDVWVCDVTPAPDASRLAVLVRGPRDRPPELVKERLERVSAYLRTEVAQAITRKRAPTLTFEILPPEIAG